MICRQAMIRSPLARIFIVASGNFLEMYDFMVFGYYAPDIAKAQSSVSARAKMLEEDLGILLFERHARGVHLTQETNRRPWLGGRWPRW